VKRRLFVVVAACTFASVVCGLGRTDAAVADRLTNGEFWSMITRLSEPDGQFRSDNLVSNEIKFQWVIPEMLRRAKSGGIYIGVGPEQNFT